MQRCLGRRGIATTCFGKAHAWEPLVSLRHTLFALRAVQDHYKDNDVVEFSVSTDPYIHNFKQTEIAFRLRTPVSQGQDAVPVLHVPIPPFKSAKEGGPSLEETLQALTLSDSELHRLTHDEKGEQLEDIKVLSLRIVNRNGTLAN